MQFVLSLVDKAWNLAPLKGYRSLIARAFLIGVSAYQALASAKAVHDAVPLPLIPMEVYGTLTAYFGLQLEKFAKEHQD